MARRLRTAKQCFPVFDLFSRETRIRRDYTMNRHVFASRSVKAAATSRLLLLSLVASLAVSSSAMAAAFEVLVVPAIGTNPNVPHSSYATVPTVFKAVARGGTGAYTYDWDFNGDGTYDVTGLTSTNGDLQATYTFPEQPSSQLFTATVRVTNNGTTIAKTFRVKVYPAAGITDDIKANKAIEDGLWYLHKQLTATKTTVGGQPVAYLSDSDDGGDATYGATGVGIQAFQNKGHKISGDPAVNPYVTDVLMMHNYLLSKLVDYDISAKPGAGSTPNVGIGLPNGLVSGAFAYYNSLVVTALATSTVADRVVPTGLSHAGMTYSQLVQGLVNFLAYRQGDSGTSGAGLWDYSCRSTSKDGSMTHFVTTALEWSEKKMSATIPTFVRTQLSANIGLIRNAGNGAFGYSDNSSWLNIGKTGGNMSTYALLGYAPAGSDVMLSRKYIADNWTVTPVNGYPSGVGHVYTMWAIMKGSRAFDPPIPTYTTTNDATTYDWYQIFRAYLVANQQSDGHWNDISGGWMSSYPRIASAMCIEILELVFLTTPPVAVGRADATDVPSNSVVTLHHDESYHMDPNLQLALFEWDCGASLGNGVYDGAPDGTYDLATTDINAAATFKVGGPGTYHVRLRVTDNSLPTPQTATDDSVVITVTNQNHAPVAVAVPPGQGFALADYILDLTDGSVTLDGSASSDPDTADHGDWIVSYQWAVPGGTLSGATASLPTPGAWVAGHTYTVTLTVTDDGTWDPVIAHQHKQASAAASVFVSADSRPTADSKTVSTNEDTQVAVTLTGTSIRDRTLSGAIVTLPTSGMLYQTADGTTRGAAIAQDDVVTGSPLRVIYVPPADANGNGLESFGYTLNDTVKTSTEATVTVNVAAVNDAPVLNPIGSQTVSEGELLTFTATATDLESPPETLTFSLDPGAPAGAAIDPSTGVFTWTASDGPATVSVTVRVTDNGTPPLDDSETVTINVTNTAPTAFLGNSGPFNEGGTGSVSFSGQSDPSTADSAAGFHYAYDFNNDGSFEIGDGTYGGSSTTATAAVPASYLVDGPGMRTVRARIIDKDGGFRDYTTVLTIGNVPPTITALAIAPGTVIEGSAVTLTGSFTDPAGALDGDYTVSVDWKDGSTLDSFTVSVTGAPPYTFTRTHVVLDDKPAGTTADLMCPSVTVTDKDGAVSAPRADAGVIVLNENPTAAIAAPAGAVEGASVTVTGTVMSDPGTLDTFSYAWRVTRNGMDFASATQGPGLGRSSSYTFMPDGSGAYAVSLTITDDDGGSGMAMPQSITVSNAAPTVAIVGAPLTGPEGSPISLTSTVTDPGTEDTFTYAWTVTKNSAPYAGGTAAAFSFTPDGPGTYVVTLTVTDADGGTGADTKTITVTNVVPTAAIVGAPASSPVGTAISLTSTVADPGTGALSYVWSVAASNGQVIADGNDATFSFTPDDVGGYTVDLAVTDSNGGTGHAPSAIINVTNVAPTAAITGAPANALEGAQINLGATVVDPGLNTFIYAWTVTKDGAAYASGANAAFSFTPDDNATYVVTVTVDDNNGGRGSDSKTINVLNVAPTAAIAVPAGAKPEGTPITLTGIATDPSAVDTFAYVWRVTKNGMDYASATHGPGLGTSDTFTFTPDASGTYVASLTTTDDDGGASVAAAQTVTVDNVAPTVAIVGAPLTSPEGSPISLTSTVTDPGTEDTFTYAWTVTKNSAPYAGGAAAAFSLAPDGPGTYVVTVTVTDADGGTGADTKTVTVTNVAPTVTIVGVPASSPEGTAIALASTATDPGLHTFSYAWAVSGGPFTALTAADQADFTFRPDDNGAYTITVTVADGQGASTMAIAAVAVWNANPVAAITGAPLACPEGTAVTLGSTASDAGAADTFTRAWSVTKNGAPFVTGGNSAGFTFTPDDNGTYVVTLTVTDDDGGVGADSKSIVVLDVAPAVSIIGAPVPHGVEGAAITLHGVVDDPGVWDTQTYSWLVTKDGHPFAIGTQTMITFTPDDSGTYEATLNVTDKDGLASSAVVAIPVANIAPTAALVGAPLTSPEGSPISLTSTVADPGTADTFTYAWSVTKNSAPYAGGAAAAFRFTPDDNGTYAVALTVSDRHGDVGVASATVTVINVAPAVTIVGAPTNSPEATPIMLRSTVTDPGTADTFTYAWVVMKDGMPFAADAGDTCTFTPDNNGLYAVTLTVTDDDDDVGADGRIVIVTNVGPTVAIEGAPVSSPEGTTLNLSSVVRDVGPLDTFTYAWSIAKNGSPWGPEGTASTFSFTPDDDGNYVVAVVASDGDGGTVSDTAAIYVTNIAPTVAINGAPATITAGVTVALASTVTDPGSADTFTYQWNVKKNGTLFANGGGTAFSFTPVEDALYEIALLVTDDDGGAGSANAVLVSQAPPVILSGPVADSNPAKPLQAVHFFCSAGDADAVTWSWDFGDGTGDTSNSNAVTHAFTPAGSYLVQVTATDANGLATTKALTMLIDPAGGMPVPLRGELDSDGDGVSDNVELAAGTDPFNVVSTPAQAGIAKPQDMTVKRMGVKLDFTGNGHDSISLDGVVSVPSGFKAAGQRIIVDVGGITRVFVLDRTGRARAGAASVALHVKWAKKGATGQVAAFTIRWPQGEFAATLSQSGLTSRPAAGMVSVPFTLLLNGTLYQASESLLYRNLHGAVGTAK